MKSLFALLAFSLVSFNAQALVELDKNVPVLICAASTLEAEAAMPIEKISRVNIYAIELSSGDMVDAGLLTFPLQMNRVTSISKGNNVFENIYILADNADIDVVVTYKVGDTPDKIEVLSVEVGDGVFTAPALAKDQAETDAIVKAGNAGFSCSKGTADIMPPIPGLAIEMFGKK